jgi:hypothetical protein
MYIGRPSPPSELVDRDLEVAELVRNLSNPRVHYCYALTGYRRIGKSSILLKVKDDLDKKGIVTVYFDVKENMSDPEFFLEELGRQILAECREFLTLQQSIKSKAQDLGQRVRQQIIRALSAAKGIGAEFSINPDGSWSVMPKIQFGEERGRDYARPFKSVFNMPNELADRLRRRIVIILDEFQDIIALTEFKGLKNVIDQFRGVVQKRRNVCYVISGSRVHMLEALLRDSKSPFYMHFKEMHVKELDENSARDLFARVIASREITTTDLDRASEEAVDLVGGHPFYLMMLAEQWDGRSLLKDVLNGMLRGPTGSIYLYANYVLAEDLSKARGGPILRRIVISLAKKPLTFSQIARAVRKRETSVGFYLDQLLRFDVIKKDGSGRYSLVDNVIAESINASVQ